MKIHMREKFQKDIEYIISVLRDAGYDPYEQLYAYAITGNETFITRKGDARNLIVTLEREKLIEYVLPYVSPKNK
ncbi:MAG: DUF965 family protein [Lachnospiraceae bacterium]|nr:DUF965 family protein [Lachnospiraceae bacterium]